EREFRGEAIAFTLNQGDMVYIPRGFVHAAECGSEASLHVTLGTIIYTWRDLLLACVNAQTDDGLRHALPLGFTRSDRLAGGLAAVLRGMEDNRHLDAVVEHFKDETVLGSQIDIAGQVMAFF